MAGDEDGAHIVLRHLAFEPIQPVDHRIGGGFALGQQLDFHLAIKLALLATQGGGKVARVLGREGQLVDRRVLVSTHAHGQHIELGLDHEAAGLGGRSGCGTRPLDPHHGRGGHTEAVLGKHLDLAVGGGHGHGQFTFTRRQVLPTQAARFVHGLAVDAQAPGGDGGIGRAAAAHAQGDLRAAGLHLVARQHVHHRGQHLGDGHRRSRLALAARLVGLGDGLAFIQRIEHAVDDVRAPEAVTKTAGRVEIGGLVLAPVDMPADQIFSAGAGVVVAGGCPEHPAFSVGKGEEGQQLLPIAQAVPADGAVAIGGDGQLAGLRAVLGDVDAPGGAGCRKLPALTAVGVDMAQRPVATQHKAGAAWRSRQASGSLLGLQRQAFAVEARGAGIFPVLDRHRSDVRRPAARQAASGQCSTNHSENMRRSAGRLVAELNLSVAGTQQESLGTPAATQISRGCRPLRLPTAIGPQHTPCGTGCPQQPTALGQAGQVHHGVAHRGHVAGLATACIGPQAHLALSVESPTARRR